MKYLLCSALILTVGLICASCGGNESSRHGSTEQNGTARSRPAATLEVIASTAILADFLSQVGGDRLRVQFLVPAGADVHTFTLSASDVRALTTADLVILNGAGLEESFKDTIEENVSGVVLVLTEELPPRLSSNTISGLEDPHFWMDIDLVIASVEILRSALTKLDPDGAVFYETRANAYRDVLHSLDDEIRELFHSLPTSRRFLVTFHDAFNYFAGRYGLVVLGFVVEGPAEEPSAGEITALITAMRAHDVHIIYREPQFRTAVVQQIAREAGAEVRDIHSSVLNDDVPTYVDLMRANAYAITQ